MLDKDIMAIIYKDSLHIAPDTLRAIQVALAEWGVCGDVPDTQAGICGNLFNEFPEVFNSLHGGKFIASYFLRALLVRSPWQHDTGDCQFPVPRTMNSDYYGLGKWHGEEGEMRRDLCLHMARELDSVIAERIAALKAVGAL